MPKDLKILIDERLRGEVGREDYDTWFRPLKLWVEGSTVVAVVPNRFYTEWIQERYGALFSTLLSESLGKPVSLVFHVKGRSEDPAAHSPPHSQSLVFDTLERADQDPSTADLLNPSYTFDNFVVGPCNELAAAACQAVSDEPGKLYNPLLLFGGAGLGKTHLLLATGNIIRRRFPSFDLHYCSCEEFTNELIEAVRFDQIARFREKYRAVDAIFLDDIQFLARRDRTQEELFHTFNALFESSKQIVLTSDKMPHEIHGLEKRLCSRFEWGLMADLQPPSEETMVAILQKKADEKGLLLPREVAFFLAKQPQTNVRVLEGMLTRIVAMSRLKGVDVTMDVVRRVIAPLVQEQEVSVEDVVRTVAGHYGVKVSDIKSSSKSRAVCRPRQVAMYLARRLTPNSFPEIGRALGNKDHSTVVKGVKRLKSYIKDDPELAERVRSLEQSIIKQIRDISPPIQD